MEPKGYPHTAIPKPKCILHPAMKWKNKHSIAYLDAFELPVAIDGSNDAEFVEFQEVPRQKLDRVVSSLQFTLWGKLRDCSGIKRRTKAYQTLG